MIPSQALLRPLGHGVANDVHKAEGVLQRVVDWERNFRGSLIQSRFGLVGLGTHQATQDVRWSTDTLMNYRRSTFVTSS